MSEPLDTLAAEVGRRLTAAGLTLVTAESCTGGWIAKVATDVAGSSGWFERGLVTYSNRAKQDLLGIAPETLAAHGAVSAQTAAAMARGALANSPADLALAVTGIAGPGGGSEDKPVGTVWFAWMGRGGEPLVQRVQFAGERDEVRHQSVRLALTRLLEILAERG
jgi:nicotinamide-nucleotide amidase